MEKTHTKNIQFLNKLIQKQKFNWIDFDKSININYFKSGGGTHLYLIENAKQKFLARINFYEPKNQWGVKEIEYNVLNLIEPINISPKAYFFSNKNSLKQDLTIVEFIEGEILNKITNKNIIDIANDLKKLHTSFKFDKAGDTFPPQDKLPYHCDIYNEFANGEDKKIEKYLYLEGINKIIKPYNRINKNLGKWFNNLKIYDECTNFSLCHADIKKENILVTKKGIKLIDWECAGSDIPESDIGRLFSGCKFTKKQQNLFLKTYYKNLPNKFTIQKIQSIKKVLDFFHILEDYIILKRKPWNSENMLSELLEYEQSIQ